MGAKAVDFANENIAGVTVSVKKYPNGVPAQYPIEIAFSGPDPQVLRNLAQEAMNIMKTSPRALNVKITGEISYLLGKQTTLKQREEELISLHWI